MLHSVYGHFSLFPHFHSAWRHVRSTSQFLFIYLAFMHGPSERASKRASGREKYINKSSTIQIHGIGQQILDVVCSVPAQFSNEYVQFCEVEGDEEILNMRSECAGNGGWKWNLLVKYKLTRAVQLLSTTESALFLHSCFFAAWCFGNWNGKFWVNLINGKFDRYIL